MKRETLGRLLDCIEAKRRVVLITDLDSGEERLLERGESGNETERANVEMALRLDRPILGESERGTRLFYQPFNPPLRMILFGGGGAHCAAPVHDGDACGLRGHPRRPGDLDLPQPSDFQGSGSSINGPTKRYARWSSTQCSAVVTLTHDPKLDEPGARHGAS